MRKSFTWFLSLMVLLTAFANSTGTPRRVAKYRKPLSFMQKKPHIVTMRQTITQLTSLWEILFRSPNLSWACHSTMRFSPLRVFQMLIRFGWFNNFGNRFARS